MPQARDLLVPAAFKARSNITLTHLTASKSGIGKISDRTGEMHCYRRTPDGFVLVHVQPLTPSSSIGEAKRHQRRTNPSISFLDKQRFE